MNSPLVALTQPARIIARRPLAPPRRPRSSSSSSSAAAAAEKSAASFWALCRERHFVYAANIGAGGQTPAHGATKLPRGAEVAADDEEQDEEGLSFGPMGVELRRNVRAAWWADVVTARQDVVGVETPALSPATRELRRSLVDGMLGCYPQALALSNRKLPFGLAQVGVCRPRGEREHTEMSLLWFCSARTASQWSEFWLRQRLSWWRSLAVQPSHFTSTEGGVGEGGATRGGHVVRYRVPWEQRAVEDVRSLGPVSGATAPKSSPPHAVLVSSSLDSAALSLLWDACSPGVRGHAGGRQVMRLHPRVAPVKVAVDLGRGPTAELRELCEGLCAELVAAGAVVWPGYRDTQQSSLEQLYSRYDEMGVPLVVVVSESTLESGSIQLRHRDTSVRETAHVNTVTQLVTALLLLRHPHHRRHGGTGAPPPSHAASTEGTPLAKDL
ncbi:DNA polymerase subunit gamma-2, mitochondrial [Lethenteron reissneri]|uniref:DNA polymerase subunit gamma-2, mitochondrial n=1 Tax=Lethenteron reissneri TaxID=7753 RepID=UPI002AB6DE18|nr:DNA polymerase subunit gamma-2, mitochondrial [Lethenteron reissneri]